MTKRRNTEAFHIFRRIATSNKKNLEELTEMNALKRLTGKRSSRATSPREDLNSVSPMRTNTEEPINGDDIVEENEEKVKPSIYLNFSSILVNK